MEQKEINELIARKDELHYKCSELESKLINEEYASRRNIEKLEKRIDDLIKANGALAQALGGTK